MSWRAGLGNVVNSYLKQRFPRKCIYICICPTVDGTLDVYEELDMESFWKSGYTYIGGLIYILTVDIIWQVYQKIGFEKLR